MAKSTSGIRQPQLAPAFRALRKAMGLGEADWQAFLGHARNGFADYEQDRWAKPDFGLQLDQVPDAWVESPEAFGHVTLRVLEEGKASLSAPVARFFLGMLDCDPDLLIGTPGIGLAWLRLAQMGLAPPCEPARLTRLAWDIPEDFFAGTDQDDLLPLCRLTLEANPPVEAWDLHVLFAAIDRAGVPARVPHRLFDNLVAADWISREVKREFCRGVLACPPEAERLREQRAALRASPRISTHSAGFRASPGTCLP
jgi:hypothetical protein